MKRSLFWALGLALITCAGVRSASASSCLRWLESIPEQDATRVPRNAKLWLGVRNGRQLTEGSPLEAEALARKRTELATEIRTHFVLDGPNDQSVLFAVTDLPLGRDGLYFVLVPVREMEPGPHRLHAPKGYPNELHRYLNIDSELRFTVVDERVSLHPKPPQVQFDRWLWNSTYERGGSDHAAVLGVDASGILIVYQAVDPRDSEREVIHYVEAGNSLYIGHSGCRAGWDFTTGPALVRVGQLDISGRFSGWGPTLRLDPPPYVIPKRPPIFPAEPSARGCGCGVPRSTGHAATSVLPLGIAWLARRRRLRT